LFADDLAIGSFAVNGLEDGIGQLVKCGGKELSEELNNR
jgi:hypothetical protein